MALFKLLRGQESDLENQPLHDGYVWVTKDLQNMWFDYYDETDTLVRKRINSEYADKLRYVADGETVELDPSEIATKAELTNALAGKANASHNHDDKYYTETEIDNKLAAKLSVQNPSAAGALTISNNFENGVASFYKSNDSTNDYGTVIRDQGADATALSVVISAKNKSVSISDGANYYDVLTTNDINDIVANKVDKVTGKGLSTNDLTNALKQNYDTAYTHSQSAHAPVGSQANIIESVKVNGTALTVTNKSVNVTVPTGALASKSKVSESDLDSSLATKLNGMVDTTELDNALSSKANTSHAHDMKELEGFFIELNNKGTKGTGHGGYLDFHYDGSGADYTSRIIESANGTLSVNGVKCSSSGITCSSIDITNGANKTKNGGFVRLNNGIILQWGTVENVANGTETWVNFPITFPHSPGGTAMLTGNYGNSYGYELHANNISASGFTIVKKGGSSTSGKDTVSWLVVGW